MRKFNKENVDKVENVNDYIHFIDDILESEGNFSVLEKSNVLGDLFEFPALNLNTTYTATENVKDFESFLMSQFIDNDKKAMTYMRERKDILKYFRKYFIRNNENLSIYEDVEPKTREFNNISYHLYKGICDIYPTFELKKDKFLVDSIVKSPLVFKVSVKLPKYIDYRSLIVQDYKIEKHLRNPDVEKDNEVHLSIDSVNDNIVFTLLRFDNTSRVSLGDVVNYGTGYPYQLIRDSEFKLPCLVGLIDNEIPLLVDLEGNGNIALAGVKKTPYLAYSMAMSMVLCTHYDDVQFVILNQEDTDVWHMFSRMPHVLGYHSDIEQFVDIIEDLYKLSLERFRQSKIHRTENFSELKNKLGNHHAQVYLILDNSTRILNYYKTFMNDNGATYSHVVDKLNRIAKLSHITGVSIFGISQRADSTALPHEIVSNSTVRVGAEGCSENDYQELFGRDVQETGVAVGNDNHIVSYDNITSETEYIRTPVVGGIKKSQTLSLIRVVALEWVRKSMYDVSLIPQPDGLNFHFAYNRDIMVRDSLDKIKEGKILPNW